MTQPAEGHFFPAFHFLGLIQKAISDGITRHCIHLGSPDVYIVPSENAYYSSVENIESLRPLCLAPPFDVTVELVPDWHPKNDHDVKAGRVLIHRKNPSEQTDMLAYPLQALLWYATLCASSGQLLQGYRAESLVRLAAMPDFSSLYHQPHHVGIAAAMMEESSTLPELAQKTGVALTEVINFHNACAIINLITIDQSNLFDPANYLLGLIKKVENDTKMWRCSLLSGQGFLILSPSEGKFYSEADPTTIGKLCSVQLQELEVTEVATQSEEEEIVQIGRARIRRKKTVTMPTLPDHPLAELRFRAALYASQGRLLVGYDENAPVHLNQWPDKKLLIESASIKAERYVFPLAAYMNNNTASLSDIAQATRLPLSQVIDFHNACAITGLLASN